MNVLKIKFGSSGEHVNAFGMRFYGDIDSKARSLGHIGKIISDPDMSPITKNKRITFWFAFETIRPYKKVSYLLNELTAKLTNERFEIINSSIDELVDTTAINYAGKPESRFPASDRMHSYNAAGGFSITVERHDTKSNFSITEIETIMELAIKFALTVYGHTLKKVDVR